MAQEYVDAVRRSIDGWNRDDFDTCVSIAHPEIEWVSDLAIRGAGLSTGAREFRRYWDEWHDDLDGDDRRGATPWSCSRRHARSATRAASNSSS